MAKITGLSLLWDTEKLQEMKGDPVPPLTKEERQGLLDDIKQNGIEEPLQVVHTSDDKYIIMDGRHRFGIAKELGIKKVPILLTLEEDIDKTGLSLNEYLVRKAIRLNIFRRQLSSEQRVKLLSMLFDKPVPKQPKEKVVGRGHKGYSLNGEKKSANEVAKELGISLRMVKQAKKYKETVEAHPELAGLSVRKALQEAKKAERGEDKTELNKEMHRTRLRDTFNICTKCGLFPCEYLETIIVNIMTSSCGRQGGVRGATKTNIQELIEFYKVVTGVQADDKGWDRVMFAKLTVPARTILSMCNNDIEMAKEIVNNGRRYFERKGWKWTLFTIAKPNVLMLAYKGVNNGGKGCKKWKYEADIKLGERR